MRDITAHPITADETIGILKNIFADLAEDQSVGGVDGLALTYLGSFLDTATVRAMLTQHLDIVQPKRKYSALEKLKLQDLKPLISLVLGRGDTAIIYDTSEFIGRSERGSYMYLLNKGYKQTQTTLFVRLDAGQARAEINEDNFSIPMEMAAKKQWPPAYDSGKPRSPIVKQPRDNLSWYDSMVKRYVELFGRA